VAVQYVVRARVFNLRRCVPAPGDSYIVDTNVWYWTTYSRASLSGTRPKYYQVNEYPAFITGCLRTGATLWASPLVLAELAHRIEISEWQIYSALNGPMPMKEFRHNLPAERRRVVAEIEASWSQVCSMANVYSLTVDSTVCERTVARMPELPLDSYDILSLPGEASATSSVRGVISDDGDFCGVQGLTLFTANQTVLNAARQQRA